MTRPWKLVVRGKDAVLTLRFAALVRLCPNRWYKVVFGRACRFLGQPYPTRWSDDA